MKNSNQNGNTKVTKTEIKVMRTKCPTTAK